MTLHDYLTPAVKAELAALLAIGNDTSHPAWEAAIHRICDIERAVPDGCDADFHEFLSALVPASEDCQ